MNEHDRYVSRKLSRIDLNREADEIRLHTYWCRVASGKYEIANTKEHRHSFWELHVCLGGASVIEVSGQEFKLTDGSFLLIPSQKMHRISYETEEFSKFIWGFSVADAQIDKELSDYYANVALRPVDPEIRNSISSVLAAADMEGFGFYNIIKNFLYHIFICLSRDVVHPEKNKNYEKSFHAEMEAVCQYIRNNLASDITADDISAQFLMSKSRLEKMSVKTYNLTLSQLKASIRMESIRGLLAETSLSLDEISALTGFSDRYSMGKFFKKHEGLPPAKYRTSLKK